MSHVYQRSKFGRERDQRRALMKSLADALILHESITTTVPKAKAVISYTEKLITKAKKKDLAARRQLISALATKIAANKLMDDLVPKLSARSSGYFRLEKAGFRRGDNTQLAKISFVDDLKTPAKKEPASKSPTSETKNEKPKKAAPKEKKS